MTEMKILKNQTLRSVMAFSILEYQVLNIYFDKKGRLLDLPLKIIFYQYLNQENCAL